MSVRASVLLGWNPAALDEAADDVESTRRRVESAVGDLERVIAQLGDAWEGDAATAAAATLRRRRDEGVRVEQTLSMVRRVLRQACDTLRAAQSELTDARTYARRNGLFMQGVRRSGARERRACVPVPDGEPRLPAPDSGRAMTTSSHAPRLLAGLLLALTALVGCTTSEPSPDPAPPSWAAATPRQTVVDVADDLKDLVIATYPDLTITPEDQVLDPRSSDCTGSPAPTGGRIVWNSGWSLQVEPKQDTVPLLEDIVGQLVTQGWALRDSPATPDFLRELDRDGYYLTLAGHSDASSDFPARISFTAYSPCLANPDK